MNNKLVSESKPEHAPKPHAPTPETNEKQNALIKLLDAHLITHEEAVLEMILHARKLEERLGTARPEAVGHDEIERAFQMLALYGVPRERCRGYVARGIEVLATRLDREERFQKAIEQDAARYRWLRDVSVPPHNFYLSVPDEFKEDRYTPQQVDAAIDAALSPLAQKTDG